MKTHLYIPLLLTSISISAQNIEGDCRYYNKPENWDTSEFYLAVDIRPSLLTASEMPITGAQNDQCENTVRSENTVKSPFGSGLFSTPIYKMDDNSGELIDSGENMNIKYNNCVLAPNYYCTSRNYEWGTRPAVEKCDDNINSQYEISFYNTPGYIELNPNGAIENGLGYIEIDKISGVERIQWAYSSTDRYHGIKYDIKIGDGDWTPRIWWPTHQLGWSGYSMQGYEMEDVLDMENDATPVSFRFRIWDGDSISYNKDMVGNPIHPEAFNTPIKPDSLWETVRIHRIKIYAFNQISTNTVQSPDKRTFNAYKAGDAIIISEDASIRLYNMTGGMVRSSNGRKINIYGIAKGIYLLKGKLSDGTLINEKIRI